VGIVQLVLNLDKMKNRWIFEFFFIPSFYSFILVGFFPTAPTFTIFDFVTVIKAEPANNPWRIRG
jgi:hypothetical protein